MEVVCEDVDEKWVEVEWEKVEVIVMWDELMVVVNYFEEMFFVVDLIGIGGVNFSYLDKCCLELIVIDIFEFGELKLEIFNEILCVKVILMMLIGNSYCSFVDFEKVVEFFE